MINTGGGEDGGKSVSFKGGAQYELYLIQVILFLSLLLRNIGIPWIFLGRQFSTSTKLIWLKFSLDISILVTPGLLCVTTFASSIGIFLLILLATLGTLILFVLCEFLIASDGGLIRHSLNQVIEEQHGPTMFFSYFRGLMLIFIGVAILAVDFPVFPSRYAKTELYGHSLMDIGVASCVVADALGRKLKTGSMRDKHEYHQHRRTWKNVLLSSRVLLPFLGFVRTFTVWLFGYHQPVTEYGIHWNFFFTMAIVSIVTRTVKDKFPGSMFLLFATIHQTILSNGMEYFILFGENSRDTLFLANIEGIISIPGYLCIFYAASAIGDFIAATGIKVKSWLSCCMRLFVLSFTFFCLQNVTEIVLGPPSRRVANLSYVLSQMSLLTFVLALLLLIQMINIIAWFSKVPNFSQATNETPFSNIQPCLLQTVNEYGLLFFLITNLLTGLINLNIDTKKATDNQAVAIIMVYMLVSCGFLHYRRHHGNPDRKIV